MKISNAQKRSGLVAILIFGSLVFIGQALYNRIPPADEANELRTMTSLNFCSEVDDKQCDQGVATLDLRILSRESLFRNARGFPNDTKANLKLQSIELKFIENSQTTLDNQEFFLYIDSNQDGIFDEKTDRQLVRGLSKKKRLLFEDINHRMSFSVPKVGLNVTQQFFIYSPANKQVIPTNTLDKITVQSINLARDQEIIENLSSFADNSKFKNLSEVSQTRAKFLKNNPMFKKSGAGITLPAGDYAIDTTLVTPKDVPITIEGGVNIKIAPGVSFVSYSPINFNGTASKPITVTSSGEEAYGTFAIVGELDDKRTVNVNYTTFDNGSQAEVNGAFLSGMFSVYRIGKTNISNSTFIGSKSDDGLNIKFSDILLTDNTFRRNSADAFDGDFVTGLAERNLFINNGNDSLDFSGSNMTVRYNNVINSGDKCVSVGESTVARITLNYFDGCNIGVEVKDRSMATITRNAILNSDTIGINAYVKKLFFGDPTLTYSSNIMLGNPKQTAGLVDKTKLNLNTTTGKIDTLKSQISWLADILREIPKQ